MSTDPFELAEKCDELFSKGEFKEAAYPFILSAIYGYEDNKATLVELDPESMTHLNSHDPFSEEALTYYNKHLTPKIVAYFKDQSRKLNQHKDMPVKVLTGK